MSQKSPLLVLVGAAGESLALLSLMPVSAINLGSFSLAVIFEVFGVSDHSRIC